MSENKVIDGLIYSKELEQYVDIKEWLQHIMSLANSTQEWNFDLKWTSCSDSEGNRHYEPLLNDEGFEAAIDLYEDEDGDDDYGRTIIRKIWSVRLLGIKLNEVINIKN